MNNKYLRELPKSLLIGVAIFIIMILIRVLNGESIKYDDYLKYSLLYTLLYSVCLHMANTVLFIYLDKCFIAQRFSLRRIIIGFLSSFILSILVIFCLRIFEDVVMEKQSFDAFLQQEKASNYIVASVFTLIIILIVHLVYFYKEFQENKVKEQKIIAGTANAKFESLKNQIDPHFLFNSLNVLSSLIEENPENAQKFTTSLSKIYRYVLEQKDKELILLNEELNFAKTYMNLLKMRFENSLTYEILVEDIDPEAKVVPLSLQLLLENTVKHNIISEQKPLKILIYITSNYLCIQNDYQKKEILENRQGVGLQNIINRYGIITNRKVLVEKTENYFTVKIPILTKQISVMEMQEKYSENTAYYRAKKRVGELKGFYGNLISYCIIIPIIIIINLTTNPEFQWFWFPMLGWGMGVTFHALSVFGYSKSWEERKIKEIMNKSTNQKQYM